MHSTRHGLRIAGADPRRQPKLMHIQSYANLSVYYHMMGHHSLAASFDKVLKVELEYAGQTFAGAQEASALLSSLTTTSLKPLQ